MAPAAKRRASAQRGAGQVGAGGQVEGRSSGPLARRSVRFPRWAGAGGCDGSETGDRGASRTSDPVAFLDAVLDATADAVFGVDADGAVTVLEPQRRADLRLDGRRGGGPAGRRRCSPLDVRPTIAWLLDIVATGDRIERYDVDVERKGGMPTPISMSLRPVDRRRAPSSGAVGGGPRPHRAAPGPGLAGRDRGRAMQEGEALTHVGRWLWDVATRHGPVERRDPPHPRRRSAGRSAATWPPTWRPIVLDDRQRVADAAGRRRRRRAGRSRRSTTSCGPSGETRHLYARAEPTIGANGAVIGLRGIIRDSPALTGRSTQAGQVAHPLDQVAGGGRVGVAVG